MQSWLVEGRLTLGGCNFDSGANQRAIPACGQSFTGRGEARARGPKVRVVVESGGRLRLFQETQWAARQCDYQITDRKAPVMGSSMTRTSSSADSGAISAWAARLSLGASIVAIGSLAALQALSPEFDPSSRVVSEYALGDYWWVLSLMFISWGVSSWALAFAIRSHVKTLGGKIGLALLVVAGAGEAMAAFFDVRQTVMHNVAGALGVPCLPIAATLISTNLGRTSAWRSSKRSLRWTVTMTWVSLALMGFAMAAMNPKVPLKVPIGWPNRLLIAAYCAWAMTVAWQAIRLRRPTTSEGAPDGVS